MANAIMASQEFALSEQRNQEKRAEKQIERTIKADYTRRYICG